MKKLLGIFAHPDDESYLAGGTIAKYVKAGWRADLVCATKGESGMHRERQEAQSEDLASTHARELEAASACLDIRTVTFLDYKDGKLSSVTPGDLEDKLCTALRDNRPDVVITFEPTGVTNNPDHTKLTLAATFAFQKYAEDRHEEAPEDLNPPKLYFACEPASVVSYLQKIKYYPKESFGKPWTGVEDKKITTVIDISRTAGAKEKALASYSSHGEEIDEYLSIEHNPFLKQEYFILRYIGINEVFLGKNDRVSDRL